MLRRAREVAPFSRGFSSFFQLTRGEEKNGSGWDGVKSAGKDGCRRRGVQGALSEGEEKEEQGSKKTRAKNLRRRRSAHVKYWRFRASLCAAVVAARANCTPR